MQLHVADSMGYHWATAFQDTAEKILGKTAEEMGNMRDNEDMFDFTVKSALLKPYQLTLRSKMESYNVSGYTSGFSFIVVGRGVTIPLLVCLG